MANTTLMTPIDVYPSKGQVVSIKNEDGNPVAPIFSFKFQGDLLSWIQGECYDVDTDECMYWFYVPKGGRMGTYHNGDTIRISETVAKDTLTSGRNYKYFYRLLQNNPATGQPQCDIRYASGRTQGSFVSSSGYIDKGMLKLHDPWYYTYEDKTKKLLGCTYIEIGHERRMITSYDKTTGKIGLSSGFSETIEANSLYRLYCNYIETQYYDYKIRDIPKVTVNAIYNTGSEYLKCFINYSHPNNVNVGSYQFKIYSSGAEENFINGKIQEYTEDDEVDVYNIPIEVGLPTSIIGKYIMVEQSPTEGEGKVISGKMRKIKAYNAETGIAELTTTLDPVPEVNCRYSITMTNQTLIDSSDRLFTYDLNYECHEYIYDQQLTIECEILTKENQLVTQSIKKYIAAPTTVLDTKLITTILPTTQAINIKGVNSNGYFMGSVYRQERGGKWVHLGRTVNSDSSLTNFSFTDYTAGNNIEYRYMITSSNYKPITSEYIKPVWNGWTISSLTPSDYTSNYHNKKRQGYEIGETWYFISAVDAGSITQNLGIVSHIGTSKMPTTSRTNNKYQSGSFSADLFSIKCPNNEIVDDISRVNRWNKFISDDNAFLLKSSKGDVWIINIVNNPARTYQSEVRDFTNVTYDWIEVDNTDNVYIK